MKPGRRDISEEIAPDEIFLDATNLPAFDTARFEGRLERPLGRRIVLLFSLLFLLSGSVLLFKVTMLQVVEGATWSKEAEANRLRHAIVFPARGLILDREGESLAWNVPREGKDFFERAYTDKPGFGHLLGFLHYPKADDKGIYYRTDYEAPSGIEEAYHERLSGKQGLRIIETDAVGNITSENVMERPEDGETIRLSIDARLQEEMFRTIRRVAEERGFSGGAGGMIDIGTGELRALVSYPEFDPNIMTAGTNTDAIAAYNADTRHPFLYRAIAGLYTPGSIVKPIVAIGALNEGVIGEWTEVYSSGSIKLPNPFFPGQFSVFNDWKAHGTMDMRRAIAVSSNVYFYEVGGGFQGQKGLGIERLEKYARMFGFGAPTGIDLAGEETGTYPNPSWKERVFDGDPWRIGDTYFTAIGQYGTQITPIQAIKEAGLIAARGKLPEPHLLKDAPPGDVPIAEAPLPDKYFSVIQEGMRRAVTEGTAAGLGTPAVRMAGKTGTAELGVLKNHVNSWVIGFFPYENPKYAFALVMERGPKGNTYGATYAMRQLVDWMDREVPEYFGKSRPTAPPETGIATGTPPSATGTPIDIDETPPEAPPEE